MVVAKAGRSYRDMTDGRKTTTSLFTAIATSRELWREDPFFEASYGNECQEEIKLGWPRPSTHVIISKGFLSYMRSDHSWCLILAPWTPCLQASLGCSRCNM